MGKTLALNALKKKQTKSHLKKAKDVMAKQRQTQWEVPEGGVESNERRGVWGEKLNLIARMKSCGMFFKKKPRMLPFLKLL